DRSDPAVFPRRCSMPSQLSIAPPSTVEVAGVPVGSFTTPSLTSRILEMARSEELQVAVGVNAHVCNLARRDDRFSRLLSSSTTYADGQSVVWAGRMLGATLPEHAT